MLDELGGRAKEIKCKQEKGMERAKGQNRGETLFQIFSDMLDSREQKLYIACDL